MSVLSIPKFYSKMPIMLQNIAVSVGGLRLHYLRRGRKFSKVMAKINYVDTLNEEETKRWQLNEVKKIIEFSYNHVPFYKKRFDRIGFKPDDLITWDDFKKIPLTTKDDLVEYEDEMHSKDINIGKCFKVYTTGTTGMPRPILTTRDAVVSHYAHFIKTIESSGVNGNSEWVRFGGTKIVPENQKKAPYWRYNYFEKQMYMSIRHISKRTIKEYIKALNSFQPVFINGFPSVLSSIAEWLLENKEKTPSSIKLVICDSESLFPRQKVVIEKAFACRVLDYYGLAEKVAFMIQCEKDNYHCSPTYGVVEFISNNKENVNKGIGMIVGTTLINYAMPLIRYATEDIAMVNNNLCECCLPGPYITNIEGRMGDFVYTPSGKIISPSLMEFCMRNVRNAKKVLVEQDNIRSLNIHFYPDRNFKKEEIDDFIKGANELTNKELKIKTTIHSELPPEEIKYRFVLSHIASEIFKLKKGGVITCEQ